MLTKTQDVLDRASVISVWAAGAALLLTAFMVGIEVIMRKLFNSSLGGADEISGYIFASATAWSYAAVIRNKGNVRIDVIYNLFPRRFQTVLDIISFIALGAFFGLIAWYGFELVKSTVEAGRISVTPLRTPLAIPQISWILGIGLALLMWALIALRVVANLLRRNWSIVQDLIGAESLDVEIDAEFCDKPLHSKISRQ